MKHSSHVVSTLCTCRCWSGGTKNPQADFFKEAAANVAMHLGKDVIKVQCMTLKSFRELEWTLDQLITWMFNSHIHFFVAHFHQGLDNFGHSISELYAGVEQLKFHEGFPSRSHIECPIFTQDKWKYLDALPKGSTLPTIPILMSPFPLRCAVVILKQRQQWTARVR
jgi:hypothetical protein